MIDYDFNYLIKKIEEAEFLHTPFKHLYIENFFSDQHFSEIIQCNEIKSPIANTDEELIDGLYKKGFKIIDFPGCVTDKKTYIEWHKNKKNISQSTSCEGFGLALRLFNIKSAILRALIDFIGGENFNQAIARKFNIKLTECSIDGGLQKYLDGYEISPHPDIRKKAATFMVNINPVASSDEMNFHTHYMHFIKSREYIGKFWEGNPKVDRAWVPWDWAISNKRQTKNNSIVLFSPSHDTLHAVKADYNHLKTQRTQLYGNIWYKETDIEVTLPWEALDFDRLIAFQNSLGSKSALKITSMLVSKLLPKNLKTTFKKLSGRNSFLGERNID